jgi:hypothetical protein
MKSPIIKIFCEQGNHEIQIDLDKIKVEERVFQDQEERSNLSYTGGGFFSFSNSKCIETKQIISGIYKQKYILCPLDGFEIELGDAIMVKQLGTIVEKKEIGEWD